jgi:hypothetical protein
MADPYLPNLLPLDDPSTFDVNTQSKSSWLCGLPFFNTIHKKRERVRRVRTVEQLEAFRDRNREKRRECEVECMKLEHEFLTIEFHGSEEAMIRCMDEYKIKQGECEDYQYYDHQVSQVLVAIDREVKDAEFINLLAQMKGWKCTINNKALDRAKESVGQMTARFQQHDLNRIARIELPRGKSGSATVSQRDRQRELEEFRNILNRKRNQHTTPVAAHMAHNAVDKAETSSVSTEQSSSASSSSSEPVWLSSSTTS